MFRIRTGDVESNPVVHSVAEIWNAARFLRQHVAKWQENSPERPVSLTWSADGCVATVTDGLEYETFWVENTHGIIFKMSVFMD